MLYSRALVALALICTWLVGYAPQPFQALEAASTDADHPYGDPVWSPLRNPARVSCYKSNCEGEYHGYHAIDFVGAKGDPIYAAGAGVFHIGEIDPGCSTGDAHHGTWAWIDHGPAGQTRYNHLDTIVAADGQLVTPATQIATMGSSGDFWPCETNYLHMEIRDSEVTGIRKPISPLRACIDGSEILLPEELGYAGWDDVVPHVHNTPATDNSCMPAVWPTTPSRPTASASPGVGSITVTPSARPPDVDDVRIRLELFHPSVGEFGAATEQSMSPGDGSATVSGLLDNRRYRAMVSFHNAAGWSAWSSPVEAVTGILPTPPAYRDHDSTHSSIGYKWYRGTNADADYRVAIRQANGSTWGKWKYHSVASTDLHIRIRDLAPASKFQVTVRAENDFGVSDWAPRMVISTKCYSVCPSTPGVFSPLVPARLADSRAQPTVDGAFRGSGRRSGGTAWEIQVAGRGGVPANADAAIVNLTVLNGDRHGFATVYPCGPRPTASSVNYRRGSIEPNEVIAKLSASGSICVYTQTTADVILDVVGHVTNSPYRSITPTRYADSRDEATFDGEARATGKRSAGSTWRIPVAGRGTVPSSAAAVTVNLTVTGAVGPGFATVYPCGSRPLASSVNFDRGITRANELVARLASDGAICVYTMTDVDIILDVVGYVGDVVGYSSVPPARIADTRNEFTIDGTHRAVGQLRAGSTWEVAVAGRAGVNEADAVVVNITATGATGSGFLTVFDCGRRPVASSLNYQIGTTRPNETIAKLSPSGSICIYTLSAVHVVVDLVGYTTR